MNKLNHILCCLRNLGPSVPTFYVTFEEDSEPASCPIDFDVTEFDLTGIGGSSDETFVDGDALAARVTTLTGDTWTWLSSSCRLKSTDATEDIIIPITVTYVILIDDINGGAVNCPIDFGQTEFDMTAYGGTAADTFADGAALASAVSSFTGDTWTYDSVNCRLISTDSGSNGTTIIASTVFVIDILGVSCPFDFDDVEFDMTDYGGSEIDTFADGAALATFVSDYLSETWTWDGVNCRLTSEDSSQTDITASERFKYEDYSGYRAHWDASDPTGTGLHNEESSTDVIATWHDLSGNDYDLTGSGSPEIDSVQQGGLNAINLNGTDQYFDVGNIGSILSNQEYTIFIVCDPHANGSAFFNKTLFDLGSGASTGNRNHSLLSFETATDLYLRYNGGATEFDRPTLEPCLYTILFEGTGNFRRLFKDGVELTRISGSNDTLAHTFASSKFCLGTVVDNSTGAIRTSSPYVFDGKLFEVIIYFDGLGSTDRSEIETALINKWDI